MRVCQFRHNPVSHWGLPMSVEIIRHEKRLDNAKVTFTWHDRWLWAYFNLVLTNEPLFPLLSPRQQGKGSRVALAPPGRLSITHTMTIRLYNPVNGAYGLGGQDWLPIMGHWSAGAGQPPKPALVPTFVPGNDGGRTYIVGARSG